MTVKIGNYNISDQDFKAYVDKNANNPTQLHSDLTSIGGTAKELANAYNQVYGGNLTDAQLSNYIRPTATSAPTVTPHTTTPTVTPYTPTNQDFINLANQHRVISHSPAPTVTPHTTGPAVNPVSSHPVAASSGLLSSPPRSSSNDLFSQFGFTPQQFKDYLNTGVSPSQIQSDAAEAGINNQQLTDMYNQAYGLSGTGALTVSSLNDYFNGGTNNDSNQKTPEQIDPFASYNLTAAEFKSAVDSGDYNTILNFQRQNNLSNQQMADLTNNTYGLSPGDQGYVTSDMINGWFHPKQFSNKTQHYVPQGNYTVQNVDTNVPDYKPVTTVADRLQGLLAQDNPYIQQARQTNMEEANARGLFNSSIAAGAGEKAAIQAALPIATQDVNTANQFEMNKQGFGYQGLLQNAQEQNALTQTGMQGDYSLGNTALSGDLKKEAVALQNQNDTDINQMKIDSNMKTQLMDSTGKLSQQYISDKSSILTSPNLDTDTKNTMLADLKSNYDTAIANEEALATLPLDNFSTLNPFISSGISEQDFKNIVDTGNQVGIGNFIVNNNLTNQTAADMYNYTYNPDQKIIADDVEPFRQAATV